MPDRSERYPFAAPFLGAYALGLASAQTLCIGVSLLEVRVSRAVAIAIWIAAIAIGVVYHRRLRARSERFAGASLDDATRGTSATRVIAWLARTLVAFAALLFIASWITAVAKPDMSFDGNTYHLPLIHCWARRGYIHWIAFAYDPGPAWTHHLTWLFNGYPKGVEATSFLLVRAIGSELVNTCNLVYVPLGVSGVVVAASGVGASRWAALATGAAFSLAPILVSQGQTTYVDAALGSAVAALAGALVCCVARFDARSAPLELAPLLAASAGLAATAKSSGILPAGLALVVIGVMGIVFVVRGERSIRARMMRPYLVFMGTTLALLVAFAGYWYARSWIHTGNPMGAVRVSALGHTIFPGMPLADAVTETGVTPAYMVGWARWRQIAWTWAESPDLWPTSIRWADAREGGLGYLWLLACVPATLYACGFALGRGAAKRQLEPRGRALAALVAIIGLSFAATPLNWWSRYTVWIYALGLPCLALVIDGTFGARSRVVRVCAASWLIFVLGVTGFESLYAFRHQGLTAGFLNRPPTLKWTPKAIATALTHHETNYFFEYVSAMDHEVFKGNEAVAVGGIPTEAIPILGVLGRHVGEREIIYLSVEIAVDEALLRALRERYNVRYMYWSDREPTPPPIVQLSQREDRLWNYWRVYDVGGGDTQSGVQAE